MPQVQLVAMVAQESQRAHSLAEQTQEHLQAVVAAVEPHQLAQHQMVVVLAVVLLELQEQQTLVAVVAEYPQAVAVQQVVQD
jgi:hypothetical protein